VHRNLRSRLCERRGDSGAESAGCARDKRDTAVETEKIKDRRGHGSPEEANCEANRLSL
jgi:hypothetical protein